MLKIAGSILVIGATTLFGIRRAEELKEQYRQMEYLRQLFYQLQSEIRYARSPFGEICACIGKSAKDPYGTWFKELGKSLGAREGGTFACLWKTSIREYLKTSALAETELRSLKELGERLGSADAAFQINAIECYLTQLAGSANEVHKEMKTKVRLYCCLGVMSGMLIVTLLL